jgi:hypothetical protein
MTGGKGGGKVENVEAGEKRVAPDSERRDQRLTVTERLSSNVRHVVD